VHRRTYVLFTIYRIALALHLKIYHYSTNDFINYKLIVCTLLFKTMDSPIAALRTDIHGVNGGGGGHEIIYPLTVSVYL
jgi:hypothetical protein